MIAVIFVIGLTTTACARGSAPDADDSRPETPAVTPPAEARIERFPDSVYGYFRYNSGYEDRARLVVRDEATWREVWDKLLGPHGEKPALPAVDFDSRMLLVATAGTRPTGGYSILIADYDVRPDGATARVITTSPGPTCGTTAALTEPADVVIVPRTSAAVSWIDSSAVHEC